MSIDAAVYSILHDAAGVAALVGARIYPVVLPPGVELPAVTFQHISAVPAHRLGGNPSYNRRRYQVNSYSDDRDEAEAVAAAVYAALQGYSGTAGSVVVREISDAGRQPDGYESQAEMHTIRQDFFIGHEI